MPYFKTSSDINIYYEIIEKKYYSGQNNDKIILINGLSSPTSYWLDFPLKLSDYFDVLIYDHRGTGKSSSAEKLYFINDLENDLSELIQFINWEKFHVLGISLGGFVGLKYAEKNHSKGKIKSLILVSTHPGIQYLYYPLHNPFIEFLKWKFLSKERRIKEIIKFNAGSNLEISNPKLYYQLFDSRINEKVELDKNFWLQTISGSNFWGIKYKKIDIPVLILHGRNDKVVPWQNAFIIKKLLNRAPIVDVKIYENAGHLCLWEEQENIIKEIIKFTHENSKNNYNNLINLNT